MSTKKSSNPTELPLPYALLELIKITTARLDEARQDAMTILETSALELMTLQGLSPDDGWRLDIDNRKYVKIPTKSPQDQDGNT